MIHAVGKILVGAVSSGMLLFAAAPALAHTGAQAAASFMAGFSHPFSGWDHLLAMFAVGFWAAQQRRAPALALAFPLMMLAGAAAALGGLQFESNESAIAATLAVLGVLVACAVRMPLACGIALVGLFGAVHGYAHGMEMPAGGFAQYGAGFVGATVILQLAGYCAARGITAAYAIRLLGAGIATTGAFLLAFAT